MICFYWEYLLPAIRMHTQRQRNVQGFGDLVHRVRQLTERGIMQTSAELGLCEREVAKSKVWDLQPSFCTQESRVLCSKPPEELGPRPWLLHWELLGWELSLLWGALGTAVVFGAGAVPGCGICGWRGAGPGLLCLRGLHHARLPCVFPAFPLPPSLSSSVT